MTTVLGLLLIAATLYVIRYQRAYLRTKMEFAAYVHSAAVPIRELALSELGPRFREDDLGTTLASEVYLVGSGSGRSFSTSDTEAWILSVLAKDAERIFEFGTATGRTAYLMARNAPPAARLVTLTLPRASGAQYRAGAEDSAEARTAALNESFDRFLYQSTPAEPKIEQLFCDSKQFDENPYLAQFDLIFIDGSHAYSYIKSDTEKALRMIKPGGVILWHDYRPGMLGNTLDVWRYLNELGAQLPLARAPGTSLIVYRVPR